MGDGLIEREVKKNGRPVMTTERFLAILPSKIECDVNTGCWLWSYGMDDEGYGMARFHQRPMRAHIASFIAHGGDLPKGYCVLHSCDTRLCVNPAHLRAGTQKQNSEDAVARKRMNTVRFPIAPLSQTIRDMLESGKSVATVAEELRIHRQSVRKARGEKTRPKDRNELVKTERDEAQVVVSWANWALFGKHCYFHSVGGGVLEPKHLYHPIRALQDKNRELEAKLATAVDGLNWISLKGSCPFAGGKARQTLDAIQERT